MVGSVHAAPSSGPATDELSSEDFLRLLEALDSRLTIVQTEAARQAVAPQNFGVTPGFGMSKGTLGLGVTYASDNSFGGGDPDGSVGLAVGLGDPVNAIGLDLVAGINSVTDDIAQDGSGGVKLHRRLPGFVDGGASSVAFGVNQAIRWGDADLVEPSYYGSFSTALPMPSGVTSLITLGYASNNDQFADDAVFGGLGIGWNQYIDTSVSWTGDQVTAGVGLRPMPGSGISITAGVGDLTDRNNARRAVVTLAWAKPRLF